MVLLSHQITSNAVNAVKSGVIMRELELKAFLALTQQSNNSLAMSLRINPAKMHNWKHRGDCIITFDDKFQVKKVRLVTDKLVYEA